MKCARCGKTNLIAKYLDTDYCAHCSLPRFQEDMARIQREEVIHGEESTPTGTPVVSDGR